MRTEREQVFRARILKDEASGCWVWTGQRSKDGYGQFYWGKQGLAHRFAYSFFIGPIPEGFEIDHLCRNRACCNPDHLEAVTPEENVRRRVEAHTHCPKGHPYADDNLYLWRGKRFCKECRRHNVQAMRSRRKAAA